jgi:hypothetical protein
MSKEFVRLVALTQFYAECEALEENRQHYDIATRESILNQFLDDA